MADVGSQYALKSHISSLYTSSLYFSQVPSYCNGSNYNIMVLIERESGFSELKKIYGTIFHISGGGYIKGSLRKK